ncbi:DUF6223 family protein [Actinoplanes sp. NPDC048967]|uniref:DUF6223 family protein n=1 Tax=Actinoplanes sp. NPDC048967 TaxID=3155269 RepID=UPI0033FFFB35
MKLLKSIAGAGLFLVVALVPAAPAAAHPIAADVTTMSSGRLGASAGVVLGLVGVVIGWLALSRSAGRTRAVVAMVSGLLGAALGGLVMATSDGGVGTGNGLGGAIVAVAVGLIAVVLGGLAMVRSRRTGRSRSG